MGKVIGKKEEVFFVGFSVIFCLDLANYIPIVYPCMDRTTFYGMKKDKR